MSSWEPVSLQELLNASFVHLDRRVLGCFGVLLGLREG